MRQWVFIIALGSLGWTTAGASAQEISRELGSPSDLWSEPNPGVRYLRRTYEQPRVSVYALVIDLSQEGVQVIATPEPERWDTVSHFAETQDAVAAINGGFWGTWQRPSGITAGGGELWSRAEPSPDFGHFAVRRDGRAVVRGPGEGERAGSLAQIAEAISGRPILVRRGRVDTETLDSFETANQRQPRTAVGVSRDGRRVVMVVVDGRQTQSRGLTLYQLARELVQLGAHRAINLDGGGSSVMYVREAGGIVSSPCRGRWAEMLGIEPGERQRVRTRAGTQEVYVRGEERQVMTHLAVIAPGPAAVPVQGGRSALGDGLPRARRPVPSPPMHSPPARSPIHDLRLAREVLYPLLYVTVPLLLLLSLGFALRRVLRRFA